MWRISWFCKRQKSSTRGSYKTRWKKVKDYTVYNYLNVYYLTEEFQSIVLSGFGVTKLYRYKKLIYKTVEYDNDLYTLLTTPFPGIEATDINIHNLSIDEDSNDMN